MSDKIAAHIAQASHTANAALGEHANPTIQAAIAQAHALTAIALLLQQLIEVVESDAEPEMFQTVRIIGSWPNGRPQ